MRLCGYVLGLPIVHGVGHLCLGMERVEEEGAKWKLGSGLSFWVDPWVSQSELIEFFPQPDRKRMIRKEGKMKVSEVVHIDREGTIAELEVHGLSMIRGIVGNVRAHLGHEDALEWHGARELTSKKAWEQVREKEPKS